MAMDVLYKYVPSGRVLSCLPEVGDGSLRVTQPASLNDPFECSGIGKTVERDLDNANLEFARVLTSIHDAKPVSPDDVDSARERFGTLFRRELLSMQLSHRVGVVSFSSDARHPLLWSHYTVDGSGFVIAYDAQQLENLVGEGSLLQVRYRSSPPIIDYTSLPDRENLLALLSHKGSHWQYEKEWRLIVELKDTIGTGDEDRHGLPINLVRIPNPAVKRVYYTERSPTDTVDGVRSRLADANNRYTAAEPEKLVLSATGYHYVAELTQPA